MCVYGAQCIGWIEGGAQHLRLWGARVFRDCIEVRVRQLMLLCTTKCLFSMPGRCPAVLLLCVVSWALAGC